MLIRGFLFLIGGGIGEAAQVVASFPVVQCLSIGNRMVHKVTNGYPGNLEADSKNWRIIFSAALLLAGP